MSDNLPTLDDIVDPDFCGGLDSVEYLERLREGTLEESPRWRWKERGLPDPDAPVTCACGCGQAIDQARLVVYAVIACAGPYYASATHKRRANARAFRAKRAAAS